VAGKKSPFNPLQIQGKNGSATPEDLNRVQDQIQAAFKKVQQGGVGQVTSRDGTVILTPATGVGTVDLSVPQKIIGSRVTQATTLDPVTNAPNDLDSTTAAKFLEIEIDGIKYVAPLWRLKVFGPFIPPGGLKYWFKADDTSAFHVSGSNVTGWDDSLGSGFNLNILVGSPIVGTVNGLNSLRTSIGNKLLRSQAAFAANHPRDIYMVAQTAGNQGYMAVGMGSYTGGINCGFESLGGTSRYTFLQWFGADAYFNDGSHNYSGETHIFRYSLPFVSSNDATFEIDGVAKGLSWDSSFSSEDGAAQFSLGGFADGVNNGRDWDGNICEVLIFDHVLSAGDDLTVRTYLQPKWATP
jgi:hypothetical protein